MLDRYLRATAFLTKPCSIYVVPSNKNASIRLLRTKSWSRTSTKSSSPQQLSKPDNSTSGPSRSSRPRGLRARGFGARVRSSPRAFENTNHKPRRLWRLYWFNARPGVQKGLDNRAIQRLIRRINSTSGSINPWQNESLRLSWRKSPLRRLSWLDYCADLEMNRENAIKFWLRKPKHEWYSLMLWSLRRKPLWALIPLDVAIHCPRIRPSRQILQDCISALAKILIREKQRPRPYFVKMIHQFTCDYAKLNSSYGRNWPFQQHIIWLVLANCDQDHLRSLFRTLLTYNIPLSSNTLLQFAGKFLEHGQSSMGFEIIRSAINVGADLSSMAMQSSCVKLLRVRPKREDWYRIQSAVVTKLLDMGIKPNVALWTCIIQIAVEAGNYREAWHWYDTGISDGLKPDCLTFLILLRIAKDDKDEAVFQKIREEATKEGILPHDMKLVFDLLHALGVIEGSNPRGQVDRSRRAYETMIHLYRQYCDLKPLQEMGMDIPLTPHWNHRDDQCPEPTPTIVGIMLMAYIRCCKGTEVLRDLYTRYCDLVLSRHPIIAPIANTDHIGNAFVMGLGEGSVTLHHCTAVVKHMLQCRPFGVSQSTSFPSTTPDQTGQPTLQTWNILIRSYTKHGHIEAAEKVLSMLRSRGFRPDEVTWNQLISGYVAQQDVGKVIGATKAMNMGDLEYDERTIAYLQRLTDKPQFFKALNHMYAELDDLDQEARVFYGNKKLKGQSQDHSSR